MPTRPVARPFRHRAGAFVATIFMVATGTLFGTASPAAAAPQL